MKKDIILCDLDGTIALVDHRRRHVEGKSKDWKAFHAACVHDEPNGVVIDILTCMRNSADVGIWIVSGRDDSVKAQTREWLQKHGVPYDMLVMRRHGDHTEDQTLKRSWLHDGTIPKERVFAVFDDRARVCAMWRQEGLTCLQVAPGEF